MNRRTLPKDESSIVSSSQKHAQLNIHRLTFSTTAFPFVDPSPIDPAKLLGIRIDICRRDGKFDKPYYVLLKRSDGLRVYRHTIPVFISIRELEDQYLPSNIHLFVRKLRQELNSWIARCDAIELLQETSIPNIRSVAAVSQEARYVRLEWNDGRIGRIKLSNKGLIERAVVYGLEGRAMKTEKTLADGNQSIEGLVQTLESC